MARADIKQWAKTEDGHETISSQVRFCLSGKLWQGFHMIPVPVQEKQLTDDELRDVQDKDGTMIEIWKQRTSRLESRVRRKADEYDLRLAKLRTERLEIRNTIVADREDKLPASPDSLSALRRVDKRMSRLIQLRDEEEEGLVLSLGKQSGEPEKNPYECKHCGDIPPPTHKKPGSWLNAHIMGAHKSPTAKDPIAEEVATA